VAAWREKKRKKKKGGGDDEEEGMKTEFGPASNPHMTHPCKPAFCRHVPASDFKFRMRSVNDSSRLLIFL
jgi:hypothetical protein